MQNAIVNKIEVLDLILILLENPVSTKWHVPQPTLCIIRASPDDA
jgi:hypothetical protein